MAYKDIKLNCDLGEELYNDDASDTIDSRVMPYIDMANVACGGHAGDVTSMSNTVQNALSHNVLIGAHPSYPDRENFGRISLDLAHEELSESLYQQVSALNSVCSDYDSSLNYIKPHGALYHDCIQKESVLECVIQLAQKFALPLMLLCLPKKHTRFQMLKQYSEKYSVPLIYEGFADRMYDDEGELMPRSQTNAVHQDLRRILNQAKSLIMEQGVQSVNSHWLDISCDSLCVHGDTPLAFDALKSIRAMIDK